MRLYILESDVDKFQSLGFVNEEQDWEVTHKFDGTPQGASWEPPKVEVYVDDGNRGLAEGDFPHLFGHLPVFSDAAAKKLEPILSGNGEFLRLTGKQPEYVAFNVTNMIDGLNVERSEIVYFPSGKVLDIKRFVFDAGKISTSVMFKIPQMPLAYVFVTETFVSLVRDSNLRGFLFTPVEVINDDV
jgi:hypothetical protein